MPVRRRLAPTGLRPSSKLLPPASVEHPDQATWGLLSHPCIAPQRPQDAPPSREQQVVATVRAEVEDGVGQASDEPGAHLRGRDLVARRRGTCAPDRSMAARSSPRSSWRSMSPARPVHAVLRRSPADPRPARRPTPGRSASSARPDLAGQLEHVGARDRRVERVGHQVRRHLGGQLGGAHLAGDLREGAPPVAERRRARRDRRRPRPAAGCRSARRPRAAARARPWSRRRARRAPRRTSRAAWPARRRAASRRRARSSPSEVSVARRIDVAVAEARPVHRQQPHAGRRGAGVVGPAEAGVGRAVEVDDGQRRRGRPRRRRRAPARRAAPARSVARTGHEHTRKGPWLPCPFTRDVDHRGGTECRASRPTRSATWRWWATGARARPRWWRRCSTAPARSTGWGAWRTAPR